MGNGLCISGRSVPIDPRTAITDPNGPFPAGQGRDVVYLKEGGVDPINKQLTASTSLLIQTPISPEVREATTADASEVEAKKKDLKDHFQSAWRLLETEAKQIQDELQTLSIQLEQGWIKGYLLTEKEQGEIQQDIAHTVQLVEKVAQAAQGVDISPQDKKQEREETLENAMKALARKQRSIEKQIPPEKKPSALLDIVTYLSPLVGGIWYLLIQLQLLVASAPLVVGIAFVAWMWVTLINVKQRIENRIAATKAEDRNALVKHYRSLIVTFEDTKTKMNMSDLTRLSNQIQQLQQLMLAKDQKPEHAAINGVAENGVAELSVKNGEGKEALRITLEKLLKNGEGKEALRISLEELLNNGLSKDDILKVIEELEAAKAENSTETSAINEEAVKKAA